VNCAPRDAAPARGALEIGIVGGGGAGLTAAWLLDDTHRVTLYEGADRLGGHAHTVDVDVGGTRVPVDSGVDFFWPSMWPTFSRLVDTLAVPVHEYVLTGTLYRAGGGRVYQIPLVRDGGIPWSMLRPHQMSTLLELRRALAPARALVDSGDTSITVERFVEGLACSPAFRTDFFFPLLRAGWCMDAEDFKQVAAYDPLAYLVRRASDRLGRPRVMEVVGGARVYVDALARALSPSTIRLSSPVRRVLRAARRYVVQDDRGGTQEFDHLVVATDARTAGDLVCELDGARDLRRALHRIEYFKTLTAIHGDRRLMPADRRDWSVFNIRCGGKHGLSTVWKGWAGRAAVFRSWVTFEPRLPDPLYSLTAYEHPKPTPAYFDVQRVVAERQGRDNLWLAGTYTRGVDSHESAVASAVAIALRLNPTSPRLRRLTARSPDARETES
jgi:predicted NAD/FAD-binding protein